MSAAPMVHQDFRPPRFGLAGEKSTRWIFVLSPVPARPSTWVNRHCPECGLLEPHHHKGCLEGLNAS